MSDATFFKNIGEYADADKYDLINNENWYCKYGYVPTTMYYVSLYGAGKTTMEFGCADGEYSLMYYEHAKPIKAYALSLFAEEIESAKQKLAKRGLSDAQVEFICHDCSIPRQITEDGVDFTYSIWMLNNATNLTMLRNMCENLYINTKKGGKCLILLATADNLMGQLIDQKLHVRITDIRAVKDIDPATGREEVVGLVVDKSLMCDNPDAEGETFFLRDCFYSDNRVKAAMESVGFTNFHQVPTLPLPTTEFGCPIEKAKFADQTHYKYFLADKM